MKNLILAALITFLLVSFTDIADKKEETVYKKVYVEWVDIIATDSGWHASEDIDHWIENETDTVKQVGFLYRETKTHIILLDSFITSTYVGAAIKIPKGNIIKLNKF